MCERLEAMRELRRCANALTAACVLVRRLPDLYAATNTEPLPAEIGELLDSLQSKESGERPEEQPPCS